MTTTDSAAPALITRKALEAHAAACREALAAMRPRPELPAELRDLRRASLDGARLVGARLVGARLDGASLVGARLDGASLDGASLDGARLDGAKVKRCLWVGPIGSRRATTLFLRLDDGRTLAHTGCFSGTVDTLLAKVQRVHGDNEHGVAYRAAAAFAMAQLGAAPRDVLADEIRAEAAGGAS